MSHPRPKTITIHQIITRCGGRKAVLAFTGLKLRAVETWVTLGCPPVTWWPILVRVSDLTYEELDRLWAATIGAQHLATLEDTIERKKAG